MTEPAGSQMIYFNGIDGETGRYAEDPLTLEEYANIARGFSVNPEHRQDLINRDFFRKGSYAPMPEYGDGSDLSLAGWGLIFPAAADSAQVDAILQALDPLVKLREGQMGYPAKIYRGGEGFQWVDVPGGGVAPQSKNDWLVKRGAGPGQVDPTVVPFHLLIVADPLSIPYTFQYELDVQYSVGRLYFNTLEEYARYAASVVAAADPARVKLARKAVFFGVANPGDNPTTQSSEHLVKPLDQYVKDTAAKFSLGWESELVEPKFADRSNLKSLLGGAQTPAFLLTASHGVKYSYRNPTKYRFQGGLICQDWQGPASGPAGREHYLAAEDIPDSHNLLGSVVFAFACFSLGTPYFDDFAIARGLDRKAHSMRPFVAALPQRLLAHPNGGALAVIGHIDRAWVHSFQWGAIDEQHTGFKSFLFQLMKGKPVGVAMEGINDRYAEIATMLSNTLQAAEYVEKLPEPLRLKLAFEYTANNDARGYAVFGDPAVCLPLAPVAAAPAERPTIQLAAPIPGRLPVVFSPDGLKALTAEEQAAVEEENQALASGKTLPDRPLGASGPVPQEKYSGKQSGMGNQTGGPPALRPGGYSLSPLEGLDEVLQAYAAEGGSFDSQTPSAGRPRVRDVVTSLHQALVNLAKKMETATNDLSTLKVSTGVAKDLNQIDPTGKDKRIVTLVSPAGDVDTVVSADYPEPGENLAGLHEKMVAQALQNRLAVAKALVEMVSGLFGEQK